MINGRFIKLIIFVTLFLPVTTFCWPNASASDDASLFGKKWMLVHVNGVEVQSNKPSITFDRDKKEVSVDGGCNHFSGSFTISGMRLKFSRMLGTQMACADSSRQEIENSFLKELRRVTRYEIRGDTLRLFRLKSQVLTFKADTAATDE